MEEDFKFDAPKFFRFTNVSVHQDITSVDPEDNRDLWFMIEHPDISPTKQVVEEIVVPQILPQASTHKSLKNRELKRREMRKISNQKKKKIQFQVKRHHSQQMKIHRHQGGQRKQKSMNKSCQIVERIKTPCPFPLRIQRNWETKSKKKWYQLSEASAKKALESMKKETKKPKQAIGKGQKRSFKF